MSLYTTAILAVVAITLTLLAFRTRVQIWLLDQVAKKIVHDLRKVDPQAYEEMLKHGGGPVAETRKYQLLAAVKKGQTGIVRALLDRGTAPDATYGDLKGGETKLTALHIASWNGHTAIVELLLKAGANSHAKDEKGRTPLALARHGGHEKIVTLLSAQRD